MSERSLPQESVSKSTESSEVSLKLSIERVRYILKGMLRINEYPITDSDKFN